MVVLQFNCWGCSTKRLPAKSCSVAVAVCPKALVKGKSKGVVAAGAACPWARLHIGSCLVWWWGKVARRKTPRSPSQSSLILRFCHVCVQGSVGLARFAGPGKLSNRASVPSEHWSNLWWESQMGKKSLMFRIPLQGVTTALKPWTVTGKVLCFIPSITQSNLNEGGRKERVKNFNYLGLWPQS